MMTASVRLASSTTGKNLNMFSDISCEGMD